MSGSQREPVHHRLSDEMRGIQIAYDQSPEFGVPLQVAPGIWWVRLPVSSSLQAINVYLLADGKFITLVDTGVRSIECREALKAALSHPDIEMFQLTRIIVTHFHPDHIGLAGEFARNGVELWTSRTTWLNCQLLSSNKQLLPLPTEVTFMQRAGLTGIELESFRRRAANRYSALVASPPDHYIPLVDGQTLTIGRRSWRVAMSYGHAAEHLSLWGDDCVISGDQILPSTSSNLTVPYTENDVDVIGEWLRSCRSLMLSANDEALCLPGHQRPFYGIRTRLAQIEENVRRTLDRLESVSAQPFAAIDCIEQVYGRTVANDEKRQFLPEVVGMLNHLFFHGRLERVLDSQGVYRYSASDSSGTRWRRAKRSKDTDEAPDSDLTAGPSPRNHAIQFDDEAKEPNPIELKAEATREKSQIGARRSRLLAISAMCMIGGVVYWNWKSVNENAQQVFRAYAPPQLRNDSIVAVKQEIVTVDTMEVVMQNQGEVPRQFTGIVRPRRASQIGFNRIGVINEILVERGDRVEADTILANLNTNLLKASLKAAEAQYRAAEARLSEQIAGPRIQTIESARALVASASAELDLAQTSFRRSERLVNVGAVSKQELDNAKTNASAKEESLKSARSTLDELLEGTRSEQVLAQRAQLSELEAAIEQLQVQLSESVLRAPFAAVVSDRFVEPGAVTAPGTTAFRLIDAESPEVWIGVPPEYISSMGSKEGVLVFIGDRSYRAKIKSVLPELDETTRTNTVILELHESDTNIPSFGQVARVNLSRTFDVPGFWVPLAALSQGDQGLWALLELETTNESETFILERREVEVVQVDSERAYVRGTIESGTQLVSTGIRRLTPGQLVKRKLNLSHSKNASDKLTITTDATRGNGAEK